MQIAEFDAILDEGKKNIITPQIIEAIIEYYPRFAKRRKGPVLVKMLNEKFGCNLNSAQMEQHYRRNKVM